MTLPIWLVAGFLGAGKTTVLRRLVHYANGRGYLFVINEFSAVDIDAGFVEREGGNAIVIAGGSVFSRRLAPEFISTLERVASGVQIPSGDIIQPQGVIIEASGMADPRPMRRLLSASNLDRLYHIAGVVAVVDPGVLMRLLLVLPNIRGQISCADLILLNKVDLHQPETIAKVRDRLALINPDAAAIRCTYGNVPPEIVLADSATARVSQMDAAFGPCRDPNFEHEIIHFKMPVDAEKLRNAFAAADADSVYRAKGAVQTAVGWQYLDWSNGAFTLEPCPPGAASRIALIWNPFTPNITSALLRELSSQ